MLNFLNQKTTANSKSISFSSKLIAFSVFKKTAPQHCLKFKSYCLFLNQRRSLRRSQTTGIGRKGNPDAYARIAGIKSI